MRKAPLRSTLAPFGLAALLAVSATAGEARANPSAPEVVKALEALRTGRFEDAIKACAPGPAGEYQHVCPFIRAHALHALGRHLEAYEALRTFGTHGGDEAKNALVGREALRSVLLANLARVSVACSASGPAEVVVNGKLAKTCPTTGAIVTTPGEIVVEVRKAGFQTAQTKIQVPAGGTATARINLVPSSGSSPSAPAAPTQPDVKTPDAATDAATEAATDTPTDTATDNPADTPTHTATDKPTEPATKPSPATEPKSAPTSAPIKPWPIPPRSSSPRTSAASTPAASTSSPSSSSPISTAPSSGSKCGPGCVILIVLGGIAVVGFSTGIVVAVTAEHTPAPTGDIPPGQARVPLIAW